MSETLTIIGLGTTGSTPPFLCMGADQNLLRVPTQNRHRRKSGSLNNSIQYRSSGARWGT